MKIKTQKLTLAAVFLCIGLTLPLLTMQVKEIGDTLLPMHFPVMLCGLICGWQYGLAVGAVLPFLRSLIFSMPPMFPNAIWMAAELATYGLVIGLVYYFLKNKNILGIYISLITAMLSGRVVWGIVKALLLSANEFTFKMFLIGGFVDSLLGIILQLIIIPFLTVVILKINRREENARII